MLIHSPRAVLRPVRVPVRPNATQTAKEVTAGEKPLSLFRELSPPLRTFIYEANSRLSWLKRRWKGHRSPAWGSLIHGSFAHYPESFTANIMRNLFQHNEAAIHATHAPFLPYVLAGLDQPPTRSVGSRHKGSPVRKVSTYDQLLITAERREVPCGLR